MCVCMCVKGSQGSSQRLVVGRAVGVANGSRTLMEVRLANSLGLRSLLLVSDSSCSFGHLEISPRLASWRLLSMHTRETNCNQHTAVRLPTSLSFIRSTIRLRSAATDLMLEAPLALRSSSTRRAQAARLAGCEMALPSRRSSRRRSSLDRARRGISVRALACRHRRSRRGQLWWRG